MRLASVSVWMNSKRALTTGCLPPLAAKDRELQALLGDLQDQLRETQDQLDAFKQRASQAEAQLHAAHDDSEKVLVLTREVKEKNLLIGKLRHEGAFFPLSR